MLSFLFSHWLLTGTGVAAILAFVGVGLLGSWTLVLNRRVIGALVLLLALIGAALWWEDKKAALKAEGAQEARAANEAASKKRQEQIVGLELDLSDARKEALDQQAMAEYRINKARAERKSHVSKQADAGCTITRGFVRDHDSDLPGTAGRAELPAAQADDDKPSGVVLSRVGSCVAHNYGECGKLQARLDACESARYNACLKWDQRFGTQSGCTR